MNLDHVSFTFMFLAAVHTGDDVDDVTDDVKQLEAEQHRLERQHICGASTHVFFHVHHHFVVANTNSKQP